MIKRRPKVYETAMEVFNDAATARKETLARLRKAQEEASKKVAAAEAVMDAATDQEAYTAAYHDKIDAEAGAAFFAKKQEGLNNAGLLEEDQVTALKKKVDTALAETEKEAETELVKDLVKLIDRTLDYLAEVKALNTALSALGANKPNYHETPYQYSPVFQLIRNIYTMPPYEKVVEGRNLTGQMPKKWEALLEDKTKKLFE